MGDGFLPKLFQKHGSEDQEFWEKAGHTIYTSPQSMTSTSTKLPTIDRSKTNSIHNVPSSANTSLTRRSRDRTKRSGMGRSPSCPSSVDFMNELSSADYKISQGESPIPAVIGRSDSISPTRHERELTKLPNIFQNGHPTPKARKNSQTSRDFPSWKSDVKKERNGFRRSESYQSLYNNQNVTLGNENSNPNGSHNSQHRSVPQTALLLPLQTDSRANKGKNKVVETDLRQENHYDFTPRGYDKFDTGVYRRCGQENEDPVEVTAHDNGHLREDKTPSPHALEIKSRHMKQWNRSNKEGQVKA
ncbi:hypothetical protein CHS0354_034560 [Potamilus streckersoni]|uniref:Uncharacterized protein n=1 Tax=Potamilus streckersoni TaxID=2493646 RepID=A0AAE0SUN8_9BIVA|nr:hypothetical protein CHS0354_034560 [Potamilus streckersoni]